MPTRRQIGAAILVVLLIALVSAIVAGAYAAKGSDGFHPIAHFDWLVAAGAATAAGTLALAFATGWLGWSTWSDVRATTRLAELGQKQTEIAQEQVHEARRLRESQFRPFVVVDLEVKTPPLVYLTITNVGPIQARNVRFAFTPPIRSSLDDRGVPFANLKIVRDGIQYLAPGKQHRLLWDTVFGRWEGDDGATPKPDFPDSYDVRVTYEADDGDRIRQYDERSTIDLGLYKHTSVGGQEGLPEIAKHLGEILKQVKTWSSSFPRGLRVVTGDEVEQQTQQIREQRRAREQSEETPN